MVWFREGSWVALSILVRLKSLITNIGKSDFKGTISVSRAWRKDRELVKSQLGERYTQIIFAKGKSEIRRATSHSKTWIGPNDKHLKLITV